MFRGPEYSEEWMLKETDLTEEALVRKSVTTHLCWSLLDQSLPSRVGLSILLISWLCGTCNRPWHIKTQFCIFCHDSHYEIKDFLLFLSPVNPTSLSIIFSRTNIDFCSTTLNYLALGDDKKSTLSTKAWPPQWGTQRNLVPLFYGAETQRTSKGKGEKNQPDLKSPDFQSTRPHSAFLPIPILHCVSREEGMVKQRVRKTSQLW